MYSWWFSIIFLDLLCILLITQIHYVVKCFFQRAQILMKIRLWPTQNDQKLTLQSNNIFILGIFAVICKSRDNNFLSPDMKLSPASYLPLWEVVHFSSNLSFPLSLREAVVILKRNNESRHLYMVSLFNVGWIKHVVILFDIIFSLPLTSISYVLWYIIGLFIFMIIMCLPCQ